MDDNINIHATAIEIDGLGVILCGPSGSGKSDLALRLIDRGARLVCDDRVVIDTASGAPCLHAVANIAGKLEIRGLGIMTLPYVESMMLRLVVTLDEAPARLPDGWPMYSVARYKIPALALNAFEQSAPVKVEWALRSLVDQDIMPVAQICKSRYNV